MPAVMAAGQWVGGMLGVESASDDEVLLTMHQRGRELRNHITRMIGWPEQMAVSTTD